MRLFVIFLLFVFAGFHHLSAQEKNRLDEQGRKQGYWEKRWSNGNLKYKGHFKDDKPVGEFIRYDSRLNVIARINYKDNDTAVAVLFHPNGKKAAEGIYINQKKQGLWRFYDRKGVLASEATYVDGVKNGPYKVYYLDGTLSRETYFVDGKENGYRTEYYANGKKRFEGTIKDGQPDGYVKYYYENGKVELEGNYRHLVRDGIWKYYDEKGKLKREIHYDLGRIIKKKE